MAASPERRHRFLYLALFALVWTGLVAVRLLDLQIVRYREMTQRAKRQRDRVVELAPRRGNIYDRNGHDLAMSIQVDSIFASPSEIQNLDNATALLAPVLKMDPAALRVKLQTGKSFSWLARRVDAAAAGQVRQLNLRGIYLQKEPQREYPNGELAAHVLGFVTSDQDGVAGLEWKYDKVVKGKKGKMLVQADAHRRPFGRGEETAPAPGDNLVLTIDEKIQFIAERELATAMEQTKSKAGTVLIMNPNNGEILALANQPTFDPNARQDVSPDVWLNRAVNSIYEPGSVMKIVTISAALEENLTNPDEVIDCQMGSINVFGRIVHDHKPFGRLTTTEIMAKSSDVGSIKLGMRLGNERFYRYIRAYGLGERTGVELPGEEPGIARPAERWNKSSVGSISMGQELGATPLQMTAAASVIAAGGVWHRPHILRGRSRPNGTPGLNIGLNGGLNPELNLTPVVMAAEPSQSDSRRVLSPETAIKVRLMLETVVTNGTGTKARLNGYTSAGKSGTAQKYDPNIGTYSAKDYIASFIGFAPATQPVVTIAVILDSPVGGHHGGEIAAPVFKRIAEQVLPYLDAPHDLPLADAKVEKARAEKIDPEQLRESVDGDVVEEASTPDTTVEFDGTAVVDVGGSLVAPDFSGKTVRAVAELASSRGLDVTLVGSGVARQQIPAPGGRLLPGRRITVKFSR
jgi:cell division protein FtsI (penicillin-binding protein 3)